MFDCASPTNLPSLPAQRSNSIISSAIDAQDNTLSLTAADHSAIVSGCSRVHRDLASGVDANFRA